MSNSVFSKLAFMTITVLLLSSCGLESMISKFNTLNFKVTPTQVETHGGMIDIALEVTIPEKYFQKNAEVEFRAALAASGDSEDKVFFDAVKLQGEKLSSNGQTIGYITGGKFNYKGSVAYTPEMMDYDLFATAIATMNDKVKNLGSVKIAEGVMATATRVRNDEMPAFSDHTYEKETILEETAVIYFSVNQSVVRYSQKSSDDIARLKAFAKKGYQTKNIEIKSFASPEGSTDINDKVSDNRSKSTFSYAKQLMRQLKVDGARNDDMYINTSLGEDWNGFSSLVNSSKLKDKSKILNVVRSQKDPQKREETIRDMSEIYDAIEEDVLPKLRKATITLRVYEPKKTDEEIATLAITDPSQLDIKEMLYAAHLANNSSIKGTIYKYIKSNFSDDHRAYNNLACLDIENKDYTNAKMNLGDAEKRNPNANEVIENKGILAAIEGDIEQASKFYSQSNPSDINTGILAIKQGNYAKAVSKLKGQGYNATLAQILNGSNVLTNETTAEADYLNAVSSARSGNTQECLDYLKNAISKKADYKSQASKDIEFIKLSTDERFNSLIK